MAWLRKEKIDTSAKMNDEQITSAFCNYFRRPPMASSYKPILCQAIFHHVKNLPRDKAGGTLFIPVDDLVDYFVRFHYILSRQFKLRQLHSESQAVYIETLLKQYYPDEAGDGTMIGSISARRPKKAALPVGLIEDARKLVFRNVIWALRKDVPFYEYYDGEKRMLEVKVDIADEQEFNKLRGKVAIEFIGIEGTVVNYIATHYPMLEKANMTILVEFLDGINVVPRLFSKLQVAAGEFKKGRNLSASDRDKLFDYQGHACFYCGGDLGQSPHADHFIPYDYMLDSPIWNMVGACARCNGKKSNHLVNSETIERLKQRNANPAFLTLFAHLGARNPSELSQLLEQHYNNCQHYFKTISQQDVISRSPFD